MKRLKFSSVVLTSILIAMIISMVSCSNSNSQSNKKPNDRVVCGDNSYVFRVGEIISDNETNTTKIQLLTDGQQILFSFDASAFLSGGTMPQPVSPVKMKIVVGDRIIECSNSIDYTSEAIYFTFDTLDAPDKIIAYSNDEAKSTVVYDGKSKEVAFVD